MKERYTFQDYHFRTDLPSKKNLMLEVAKEANKEQKRNMRRIDRVLREGQEIRKLLFNT